METIVMMNVYCHGDGSKVVMVMLMVDSRHGDGQVEGFVMTTKGMVVMTAGCQSKVSLTRGPGPHWV